MSNAPQPTPTAGYLIDTEASHLLTQAIPGAIILLLKRELEAEGGPARSPRRMFIELSLGEAVQHWQHMGELIRRAGALQQQAAHADIAGNL